MFNFFKRNDESKNENIEKNEESSKSFWNFSFEGLKKTISNTTQNLVDNDVFAQVISIESINNLGTHQLRQEGLLARRVNHLLLHGAVVWNPTHHSLS